MNLSDVSNVRSIVISPQGDFFLTEKDRGLSNDVININASNNNDNT